MRITAEGRFYGKAARLDWQDGSLVSAEPESLRESIEHLVESERPIVAPGLDEGPATLSAERPALAAMTLLFLLDDALIVRAEDLPVESLPEGAVA